MMSPTRRQTAVRWFLSTVACLVLGAGLSPRAQEPPKAPDKAALTLTGKWSMFLELPVMGQATPALEFKQDGQKITGTYTGRYGASKLEGTLKERALEFVVIVNAEGTPAKMSFWGEVSADFQSIVKGTAEVEGLGDATWGAKRDKDK
jgi:hypothetical protein